MNPVSPQTRARRALDEVHRKSGHIPRRLRDPWLRMQHSFLSRCRIDSSHLRAYRDPAFTATLNQVRLWSQTRHSEILEVAPDQLDQLNRYSFSPQVSKAHVLSRFASFMPALDSALAMGDVSFIEMMDLGHEAAALLSIFPHGYHYAAKDYLEGRPALHPTTRRNFEPIFMPFISTQQMTVPFFLRVIGFPAGPAEMSEGLVTYDDNVEGASLGLLGHDIEHVDVMAGALIYSMPGHLGLIEDNSIPLVWSLEERALIYEQIAKVIPWGERYFNFRKGFSTKQRTAIDFLLFYYYHEHPDFKFFVKDRFMHGMNHPLSDDYTYPEEIFETFRQYFADFDDRFNHIEFDDLKLAGQNLIKFAQENPDLFLQ